MKKMHFFLYYFILATPQKIGFVHVSSKITQFKIFTCKQNY